MLYISHEQKIIALRGNRTPGGSMATTQVTTTPLMLVEEDQIYTCYLSARSKSGKTGVRRRHSRLCSGLPQHTSPRHVDLDGLAHTTRARSAHTSTSDHHTYSANALLRVLHAHRTVRVLGPATALSCVPTLAVSQHHLMRLH
jgi:hypothetical protein